MGYAVDLLPKTIGRYCVRRAISGITLSARISPQLNRYPFVVMINHGFAETVQIFIFLIHSLNVTVNQILQYVTSTALFNLMLTFLTNYVQTERLFPTDFCVPT